MGAEVGVMLSYAKKYLEPPEARRGKDEFSLRAFRSVTMLIL
jgi:hypothetical protein